MGIRHKPSLKCECGNPVSKGSVFCPHCRSEVQKKNDRVIERGERDHQKRMRGKAKRGRKGRGVRGKG